MMNLYWMIGGNSLSTNTVDKVVHTLMIGTLSETSIRSFCLSMKNWTFDFIIFYQ